MTGLVIETIRPGVQFVPEAASAFRRAEAQVHAELGRNIDVNSTYRSWDLQMAMYAAWVRYVAGTGPYPGHSKAVHPSNSRHTAGLALDSDDWANERVRTILAENGFIRNQLHIPNERHHFEYIRVLDKNYGKPASAGGAASPEEDDMTPEQAKQLNAVYDAVFRGGNSMKDNGASISDSLARIADATKPIIRGGKPVSIRQELADTKTLALQLQASQAGLESALKSVATAKGFDPTAITKAAQQGVENAMRNVTFTSNIDG